MAVPVAVRGTPTVETVPGCQNHLARTVRQVIVAGRTFSGILSMKKKKIIIAGGGASGLAAAITAARLGAEVHVYEKQKSAGRKLGASGNGQCNLSNRQASCERYHGENPYFVRSVLSRFTVDDTIAFFGSIGIPVRERADGRIYPWSLQARSVVQALLSEIGRLGVSLWLHRRIDSVYPERGGFSVITAGKERYRGDSVILSMGGRSFSTLGGSTRPYELAQSLGHRIVPQLPSILAINVPYKRLHTLQGLRWDCTLTVLADGHPVTQSTDEVLFTKNGLSGPASFDVSGQVNRALYRGCEVSIVMDFLPEMDYETARAFIDGYSDTRSIKAVLDGIFKYRMGDLFLHRSGIDPEAAACDLTAGSRQKLVETVKEFTVSPGEAGPFEEAAVSTGGVSVDEVNQRTLESKLARGLYITGEMLDIDGDCGGFNLQFAWATGVLAARDAVTPSS